MSKRSSRRKRKLQKKKQQARLTGPVLTQRGLNALKQNNYDEAIDSLEKARRKGNVAPGLPPALAEAYFRRAMSGPAPSQVDLQQAIDLNSAEPRYHYHMALIHHRQGKLDKAEPIYWKLLSESPPYNQAAEALAALLVAQKKAVSNYPVWERLNNNAKTQLTAAAAVINKKNAAALHSVAEARPDPLWRGFIALTLKDRSAAEQHFLTVTGAATSNNPLPAGIAHYYLGLYAIEDEQFEAAFEHWQAAKNSGFNAPHLQYNLSVLAYQQAVQAQQANRPIKALKLLEQVRGLETHRKPLNALRQQLTLEAGYAAANKGDWNAAQQYWQTAEDNGQKSRKLDFNLALAYEKLEQPMEAAARWRQVLRRRPRRADHADALNDEQVARIWQAVAENYSKAGEFEEAIKTYKNAIKWAPDNVDLRLKLVDTYQIEGRWQAAENELDRILDKDPDNVQALLLLAEGYTDDYYHRNRARDVLLRILKLEPQHPIASQQLAQIYIKGGSIQARWGDFKGALKIYKEGLELLPNNEKLHLRIGETYADMGQFDKARRYLAQALTLKPDSLQALYTTFLVWLDNESEADLQQTLKQIKDRTPPVSGSFLTDLAESCVQFERKDLAEEILQYTEKTYSQDESTLVDVALTYLDLDKESEARRIFRNVLRENPNNPTANLHMGVVYFDMDQTRLARRHWKKGEAQARKENDFMMVHQIRVTRDHLIHGTPIPSGLGGLFSGMSSDVLNELLKNAPPEIAEMIRMMGPDALDDLMGSGYGSTKD